MAKEIDTNVYSRMDGLNSMRVTRVTHTMDRHGDSKSIEWKGFFDFNTEGMRFIGAWKAKEDLETCWTNWDIKAKAKSTGKISDDLCEWILETITHLYFENNISDPDNVTFTVKVK